MNEAPCNDHSIPSDIRFAELLAITETQKKFWNDVTVGSPDECWLWHGSLDQNGLPRFRFARGGRPHTFKPHRLAIHYTHGPLARGQIVRHHCPSRLCCNPNHQLVETMASSNEDGTAVTKLTPFVTQPSHNRGSRWEKPINGEPLPSTSLIRPIDQTRIESAIQAHVDMARHLSDSIAGPTIVVLPHPLRSATTSPTELPADKIAAAFRHVIDREVETQVHQRMIAVFKSLVS